LNIAELKAWVSLKFWNSEQVAAWVRNNFVQRSQVRLDNYTLTVPKTGTAVVGTGTAGRIAEWVTDANTLQASTLVKSGAGVLTLSAADAYTLTVPATGTASLLGTAQTYSAVKTFSANPLIANGTAANLGIQSTGTNGRSWQVSTAATGSTPVGTTAGDLYIWDATGSKLVAILTQAGMLKVLSPTNALLDLSATGSGGREWQWTVSVTGQAPVGAAAGDLYLWDTTAGALHSYLRTGGNAWFANNVSALSFTDRTPGYEGDALKELARVRARNGEIDHATLPAFAVHENGGRDLGAMISMLTVAVQQLTAKVDALEKKA
jgi:hypothetical protein